VPGSSVVAWEAVVGVAWADTWASVACTEV